MKIKSFKTQNGIVYAPSKLSPEVLSDIDRRLRLGKGALVLTAFPFMSMGYIDPRRFSCDYPLPNAFAVSRESVKLAGRLDRGLGSMAAIDFAHRIKKKGGTVSAAFDISVYHSREDAVDITDLLLDAIVFDAKCMSLTEWKSSFLRVVKAVRLDPEVGNHSRKTLLKRFPKFAFRCLWYLTVGHKRDNSHVSPDLKMMRMRGEAEVPILGREHPLVSVVIRTRHRPEVLRGALQSLRHQTYKNFECIVVEDGEPRAMTMVESEFSDLNITYHATVNNIGRSAAANLGFSMAKGKYINMLDDDDYLLPEHIMAGVAVAESGGYSMVFLQSLALLTTPVNKDPYEYDINEVHFMNFPRIDVFTMAQKCLTPNNGVLFQKCLFDELGGMREDLDAHEDWNLWLKFMTKACWTVVPFATSCFLNPFSEEEQRKREEQYSKYDGMQFDDPSLLYLVTVDEMDRFYRGFIEDFHNLSELGLLDKELSRLKKEFDFCPLLAEDISLHDGKSVCLSAYELRRIFVGYLRDLMSKDREMRTLFLNEKFFSS